MIDNNYNIKPNDIVIKRGDLYNGKFYVVEDVIEEGEGYYSIVIRNINDDSDVESYVPGIDIERL